MKKFHGMLFLVTILLILVSNAFAQTDGEKFAEGRVALDKYKDCSTAKNSFESMSSQWKQNPLWIYYMAKVHECLGNQEDALDFYVKYDALNPGQVEVIEKIGDLRYQSNITKKTINNLVGSRWKDDSDEHHIYVFKSGGVFHQQSKDDPEEEYLKVGAYTLSGNKISIRVDDTKWNTIFTWEGKIKGEEIVGTMQWYKRKTGEPSWKEPLSWKIKLLK